MFQHVVRNAGSMANEYRYAGFPLTTGGNDGMAENGRVGIAPHYIGIIHCTPSEEEPIIQGLKSFLD